MSEQTWQPIETAPKDANRLLGYAKNGWCCSYVQITVCEIERDERTGKWYADADLHGFSPTHWMPLPETPK